MKIRRITALLLTVSLASNMISGAGVNAKKISKDIRLWKKNVSVRAGENCKIKYKASKKIKVKSKAARIAKASVKKQHIIIRGIKKGKTKITVSCGKKKAYIKVTVKKNVTTKKTKGTPTPKPTASPNPYIDESVAINLSKCAASINSFSNDMFTTQSVSDVAKGKNTFVSPLSLYTALMILANGADGNTKSQICQVLGIDNFDEYNKSVGEYMKGSLDEYVTFVSGNSLWINNKYAFFNPDIDKTFIMPVKNVWNADVKRVEGFDSKAVDDINRWCSEKTGEMIPKMLEYNQVNEDTVMAIINAMYFSGRWCEQFATYQTVNETFKGKNVQNPVPMMTKENTFYRYLRTDKIEAVELDYGQHGYKGNNYAMDIILPADKSQYIGDIWNGMTPEEKLHIIDSFGTKTNPGKVTELRTLKIPRFKIDGGMDDIIQYLTGKGMTDAFCEKADFSPIGEGLCVDNVLHKAVIEVDEEGSKAAAVTVITLMEVTALVNKERPTIDFIADVPFMFIIRDRVSGTILFIGQVNNL